MKRYLFYCLITCVVLCCVNLSQMSSDSAKKGSLSCHGRIVDANGANIQAKDIAIETRDTVTMFSMPSGSATVTTGHQIPVKLEDVYSIRPIGGIDAIKKFENGSFIEVVVRYKSDTNAERTYLIKHDTQLTFIEKSIGQPHKVKLNEIRLLLIDDCVYTKSSKKQADADEHSPATQPTTAPAAGRQALCASVQERIIKIENEIVQLKNELAVLCM